MSQRNNDRSTWLGVCLLVVGIVFANKYYHWNLLGFDLNLPFELFSWPAFLLVIGLLLVICGRGVGILLMLIGGFMLYTGEFIWVINNVHDWWPLAFVIIGILILTKSTSTKKANN